MNKLAEIYKHSLALLTDLYQLTMAYGYYKAGVAEKELFSTFFFRQSPFKGGFTLACGLSTLIDFVELFSFDNDDLEYLAKLEGNDGKAVFSNDFLQYLGSLRLTCNIDAIPEGTVVFPQEPMVRVQGPVIQCQLLETALLNIINYQSLIATKASRVCMAAKGDPVLEFGLRRAHGIDGSLAASRAAYIGGCAGTSNVLAGKLYGIPVKGTHAHSWVMCFDNELEALQAYARAMPNNCVFLVDTYDTLEGVRKAAEVGKWLRTHGHEMIGIRLDSGDLAYLSIEARKILNEAGLEKTVIVASNDLDEHIITSLKEQDATIAVWGVGTRLVTAYDQPALGCVYKLTAVRDPKEDWQYRLKLSEQTSKVTNPGILQVRRFSNNNGRFIADAIYDIKHEPGTSTTIINPLDPTIQKHVAEEEKYEDLLIPVFEKGMLVYSRPDLKQNRQRAAEQLDSLHPAIKRFDNPHVYPVGLEKSLHNLKTEMVLKGQRYRLNRELKI